MGNKKILPLILCIVLVIGAFAGITVVITQQSLKTQAEETLAETVQEALSDDQQADYKKMKEAAEALIGEELTMEQVEEQIGAYEEFRLDSNGCERGVMAGLFYYKGFTLRTRTYNRGSTFTVFSVD